MDKSFSASTFQSFLCMVCVRIMRESLSSSVILRKERGREERWEDIDSDVNKLDQDIVGDDLESLHTIYIVHNLDVSLNYFRVRLIYFIQRKKGRQMLQWVA